MPLTLHRVTKAFGGLVAVNQVSFSVRPGTIHGLIGPNGAGKTTLFSLITGFYKPTSGRVELDGVDITSLSTSARALKGLVRTFQGTMLFPDQTVGENVENGMLATIRPRLLDWLVETSGTKAMKCAQTDEILEFAQLSNLRHAKARDLSHGQQRVLGIAIALAARPRVLLLDEPFTGLDVVARDATAEVVLDLLDGRTLLLATHDAADARALNISDIITL